MKLLSLNANNFGSHKHISMTFDKELILVTGATGSGKSTLLDIVSWALFGVTAKNIKVDDVRSWNNLNEQTNVEVSLVHNNQIFYIIRVRGTASQNDFIFSIYQRNGSQSEGVTYRGKDMIETQKLLESMLGITAETFTAGSYYHEFSEVGRFFTSKLKEQRELFEQIAMLDDVNNLGIKIVEERKMLKQQLDILEKEQLTLTIKIANTETQYENNSRSSKKWDENHEKNIKELEINAASFDLKQSEYIKDLEKLAAEWNETQQAGIQDMENDLQHMLHHTGICHYCASPLPSDSKIVQIRLEKTKKKLENLKDTQNSYLRQLEEAKQAQNHFLGQLEKEEKEHNPFNLKGLNDVLVELNDQLKIVTNAINTQQHKIYSLEQLVQITIQLRGELLQNAISQVETSTNSYLERFFDSEIRVKFDIPELDKLDVKIEKDGNECGYTQLSKGQRCMLKLAFSVAIMEVVSNKSGVYFENLFFDEALDGLDSELKIKAYRLFEELSTKHATVMVVDHSDELKNLFSDKIHVTLVNGNSEVSFE